ncbi:MAG: DEAD/DEAH box helicase [Rhodopila sp.]
MTAGAPVLRPYQAAALDLLRDAYRQGARAPLFVLPTAGGKTIVFAAIAAAAVAKGRRVLVLAHRRELIRQASAKLTAAGVPHGVIAPGFPLTADPVQVASVQTLTRRQVPMFHFAVIDEAHHAVSATYRRILAALEAAKLLGVTATPERLDGKGLGIKAGGVFDQLVAGPSVAELTKLGFLAPARCFASPPPDLTGVRTVQGDYARDGLAKVMDVADITGDAVEHYARLAPGKPAIAFCVSIAHAERVATAFREAGWRAQSLSGLTPVRERDAALLGLGTGAVQVVTSCELISEGLDVPSVGAVILLRPTQSLAMYLQQVGRGMRPAPDKAALIVLDHCGNIPRHGLPDDAHAWSLSGRVRRPGSAPDHPERRSPSFCTPW